MAHDPSLPLITRYIGMSDGGPWDQVEPPAYCPHCGAGGRWIHHFECEDGTTRGAMKGCIQLFRFSPLAKLDMSLTEKARERKLNKVESRVRFALDEFYAGRLPQEQLDRIITGYRESNAEYRRRFTR